MADQPDELAGIRWPHSGHTGALNVAAYCATMGIISAGQRNNGQVADMPVELYGSVSVVTGGSGWTAARIGAGGSG